MCHDFAESLFLLELPQLTLGRVHNSSILIVIHHERGYDNFAIAWKQPCFLTPAYSLLFNSCFRDQLPFNILCLKLHFNRSLAV